MVSIKVKGGESFDLHKNILAKDSAYFERALNGPFTEGQTQSIDLDDIEPSHFGIYLSVAYPVALVIGKLSLGDIMTSKECKRIGTWLYLMRLWQLADRLHNVKVKAIAKGEMYNRFMSYTVHGWLSMYQRYPWSKVALVVSRMNSALILCQNEDIPFHDDFITAISNCPPQALTDCLELLDDDFKSAVTKKFALRFADPAVTAKKRKNVAERDVTGSAKKQSYSTWRGE